MTSVEEELKIVKYALLSFNQVWKDINMRLDRLEEMYGKAEKQGLA